MPRCRATAAELSYTRRVVFRLLLLARSAWWRLGMFAAERHYGERLRIGSAVRVRNPLDVTVGSSGSVRIGARSLLDQRVTVTALGQVAIGDDCFIGAGTAIGCEAAISIGDRVAIAPYCVLVDTNKAFGDVSRPIVGQGRSHGPITIADDVWLGAGVSVMPGVTIGPHSVVAAGAVVTRSIPGGVVAAGVPAVVLRAVDGTVAGSQR